MAAHNSRRLDKKIVFALAGGSIVLLVMAVIATSNSLTAVSAVGPTIINDKPLSESSRIIKIKEVSISRESSANPSVKLSAVPSDFVVSFRAVNNGQDQTDIAVDRWEANVIGEMFSDSQPVQMGTKAGIPGKASLTIAEIDLSKYKEIFEVFPGTYTVEVIGWKWHEKDFGTYTKTGNWEDYVVSANLTVDYDSPMIKASANKLLKSDGMQVAIEGDGNLYTVNETSTKKISYYLVNEGKSDTSAVIHASQFNIWHSDNRYPSVGSMEVRETSAAKCDVLKPGEKKLVKSYEISKSGWPIGKNGIADELDSKTAKPGLYIAQMQVSTMACTGPNGDVPSGSFSSILGLEVEP